jgi:plastocyanin
MRTSLSFATEFSNVFRIVGTQLSRLLLLFALCLLPASAIHAANASINWVFPTPSALAVSVNVGETVTWNGVLSSHPLLQTNSSFSVAGATLQSNTGGSFAKTFNTAGTYYFACEFHSSSMRTTVTVCGPPPAVTALFDIDGNGEVTAATDGLLILRYLLGFRGDALIANAIGTCPGRADAMAIEGYLSTKVVP